MKEFCLENCTYPWQEKTHLPYFSVLSSVWLKTLKKETEGTLDTAVAGMRGAMEAILENAKAEMKGYVDALKNDK